MTSLLGFLALHLETRFKPEVVVRMLTRGAAIDLKRETGVLQSVLWTLLFLLMYLDARK